MSVLTIAELVRVLQNPTDLPILSMNSDLNNEGGTISHRLLHLAPVADRMSLGELNAKDRCEQQG
ncbi:MAG TPA: hypothetical protein VN648_19310 [Candidatus Methylomirabilis sp.]|nr:hypothetical protein [Candidatus Methylomirabilis sp.]